MKVRYLNYQDKCDPMHDSVLVGDTELAELLNKSRYSSPFIAALLADNGFEITTGIGRDFCCAQYCHDGDPPYLMAVSPEPPMKRGYFEFLAANTSTPIAARYIISFDELKQVLLHFLHTGERSELVSWQSLNPRALKEDTERPLDS